MPRSPEHIARELEETGEYRSAPLRRRFRRAELPFDDDDFYQACDDIFQREEAIRANFKK